MARFCSWCGKSLEPGARFCKECGARVIETVTVDGSADAVDPMRGLDIVEGTPIPADKTIKLDAERKPERKSERKREPKSERADERKAERALANTDTLVMPSEAKVAKKFSGKKDTNKDRKMLIACLSIIAILLVAIGVLVVIQVQGGLYQATEKSAQGEADTPEEETEAEEEEVVFKEEEQADGVSDSEAIDLLEAAYERLTDYNERLVSCVSSFNGKYLVTSVEQRTEALEVAEELLVELQEELEALEGMELVEDSPYLDDLEVMVELYTCQVGRLTPIVEAWQLDVTFEVPAEHQAEILAVLAQSNEGGTNKYYTRYNELYPEGAPQREE